MYLRLERNLFQIHQAKKQNVKQYVIFLHRKCFFFIRENLYTYIRTYPYIYPCLCKEHFRKNIQVFQVEWGLWECSRGSAVGDGFLVHGFILLPCACYFYNFHNLLFKRISEQLVNIPIFIFHTCTLS